MYVIAMSKRDNKRSEVSSSIGRYEIKVKVVGPNFLSAHAASMAAARAAVQKLKQEQRVMEAAERLRKQDYSDLDLIERKAEDDRYMLARFALSVLPSGPRPVQISEPMLEVWIVIPHGQVSHCKFNSLDSAREWLENREYLFEVGFATQAEAILESAYCRLARHMALMEGGKG